MRKNKTLLTLFVFLAGLFISTMTFANESPVNLLQSIADNMISQLKKNQATLKNKPQIVYKLAYQYVVPYADLDEMSKRVLPPQIWNNASQSQRDEFKKQFTLTLVHTYAGALAAYRDQTVKFYPVRGVAGKTVNVNSEIINADNSIHVSYQLIQANNGWRLLDMNVEGIGMLDSFRSQFSDILSQSNMAQLLNRLQEHNRG